MLNIPSSAFWNGKYARSASLSTAYFCLLSWLVRFLGPACGNGVEFLGGWLAFGVFLNGNELPGDVGRHCVGIVAGFDSGRGEEAFGRAVQFRFCENDRRFGVDDVGVEVGPE